MNPSLDPIAESLAHKTRQYLISQMGRTLAKANDEEIFRALSRAIRDEIMINFLATEQTIRTKDVRRLYYLSMEYLPGRLFYNNANNIANMDLILMTLQKLKRNLANIVLQESDPGLGSGGLGRLASCLLDSLATLHYPALAYGLRYQYGIFEQQIRAGVQTEAPDCWLINENPWEIRQELQKVTVKYNGKTGRARNFLGDYVETLEDFEEVWAMPYDIPIVGYKTGNSFSALALRLWSTKESPRNFQLQRYNAGKIDQAAENMIISDVLYPNELNETGKRIRFKQEFLLVSASLQDIVRRYLATHDSFHAFADKIRIQINDTHPALLIPELIRILNKDHDIPWKSAVEMTRTITSYTNHTVMREALEQWEQPMMRAMLPRQYKVIELLNHEFCEMARTKHPSNHEFIRNLSILENNNVHMANLSIVGSHKINGVSQIHSNILKDSCFKDFYELWPDKFTNVTNGVTQRLWLLHSNPLLAKFITKRIGDGWVTDFSQIKKLAHYADDKESQEEFWEIRKKNKDHLISYMKHFCKVRDKTGKVVSSPLFIDHDSLFDVQIKRFHEYKRQLMNALHILMVYHDMLENPNRIKRTCIFAGKTAPGYETAKNIIRLIFAIARKLNHDPKTRRLLQVVIVENYNVSKAQIIIPAADISEQISTAGTEASGTSVMKLAMNGALTVGTHDGANVEMNEEVTDKWWPFRFGLTAEEVDQLNTNKSYSPQKIYESNPKIQRALDALKDGSLAINEEENQAFRSLYSKLMEKHNGNQPDRYFVLHDLQDFYETQIKVEKLYADPSLWATYAIHNIAAMGKFSSDQCIKNYSEKIWEIAPCPVDEEILKQVRQEYLGEIHE